MKNDKGIKTVSEAQFWIRVLFDCPALVSSAVSSNLTVWSSVFSFTLI
jgi:hypothetical protein